MKFKFTSLTLFKTNSGSLKVFIATYIGFLLSFTSCKKEEQKGISQQSQNTDQSFQNTAYADLKASAPPAVFNDLDWSHVKINNQNGLPSLLIIKSKIDNTKVLLYSKKNGVVHTSRVQFGSGSGASLGTIVVSSLDGTNSIESSFKNGSIYATKNIGSNSNSSNITPLNAPPVVSPPVNGGGDGGDGGDGGNDDPPAYEIDLSEVTITGAPITYVDFYSLYILFGNNPSYIYDYTTDPNAGTDVDGGVVLSYVPQGGFKSIDPTFKSGQKSGTPLLKDSPSHLVGEVVGFKYTIAANGTITVSDVNASLGGLTMGNTFTMANNSYTVSGDVITITVTGTDNYNLFIDSIGTLYTDRISITLTYNTSNGSYTMTSTRIN